MGITLVDIQRVQQQWLESDLGGPTFSQLLWEQLRVPLLIVRGERSKDRHILFVVNHEEEKRLLAYTNRDRDYFPGMESTISLRGVWYGIVSVSSDEEGVLAEAILLPTSAILG